MSLTRVSCFQSRLKFYLFCFLVICLKNNLKHIAIPWKIIYFACIALYWFKDQVIKRILNLFSFFTLFSWNKVLKKESSNFAVLLLGLKSEKWRHALLQNSTYSKRWFLLMSAEIQRRMSKLVVGRARHCVATAERAWALCLASPCGRPN